MDKIVLYGAGKRGKGIYNFFKKYNLENCIYGFCDEKVLGNIYDKKVHRYNQIEEDSFIFLISVIDTKTRKDIENMLIKDNRKLIELEELFDLFGFENRVELNRAFVSFYHEFHMNEYFMNADESLDLFWNESSVFKKMFDKLDCSNIIELACGKGRHVPMYIEKANQITLVDILKNNIDYCQQRFKNHNNIQYYCNNGYNLNALESESYTSLFCYDSMVHFEMMDIYTYLQDIHRVLVSGGKVLIHHSNNSSDYRLNFSNGIHGRSYMSKDIFAHLAYKSGFIIDEQLIVDWGGEEKLDCLSLLIKK